MTVNGPEDSGRDVLIDENDPNQVDNRIQTLFVERMVLRGDERQRVQAEIDRLRATPGGQAIAKKQHTHVSNAFGGVPGSKSDIE